MGTTPEEKPKRGRIENLSPCNTVSKEEARRRGSKGGKASVEARRQKKDLRLAIEALFEAEYTDKSGRTLSGAEVIALKQMEKAMKGDWRAFQLLRDTAGQKPVEKVEQTNIMNYQDSVAYVNKLMQEEKE